MSEPEFKANEVVLALHGPLLYKAKVLKVKKTKDGPNYFVHYHKWSKKWDEWIGVDRIQKLSHENEKKQKELREKYEREDQKGSGKGKGKKRQRTEKSSIEEISATALKVNLPAELKKRLIDDWENINRHGKIMQLPVQPSVEEILDFYVAGIEDNKTNMDSKQIELSKNFVDALKTYFEHALGTLLLYRLERPLYEAEAKEKNPTKVYGAEHLLRLFVKLPFLVANTELTDEQKRAISKEVNHLCVHITKKKAHLFQGVYKKQQKEHLDAAKSR